MKIEKRLVLNKGWTIEEVTKLRKALENKGFKVWVDAYPEYCHLIVDAQSFFEGAEVQAFTRGWIDCFQRNQKGK